MEGEQYVKLKSGHKVYTNIVGNTGPKLLTLHGGPGFTHNMFANFPEHLNPAGLRVVWYDQLGGGKSDRPDNAALWQIDRFVEELHEVVTQLELQQEYVFATSTGVILLTEYLLRFPGTFKGIILSGMPLSFAKFQQNVLLLRSRLPEEVLKRLQELEEGGMAGSQEYQGLVFAHWYQRHFCLLPQWPEPLMQCLQETGYPVMQEMVGLSPFFYSGNLVQWKRNKAALQQINSPCLLVEFPQDVVLKEDYEQWNDSLPDATHIWCKRGGHLGWWDAPEEFFPAVRNFIKELENSGAEKKA